MSCGGRGHLIAATCWAPSDSSRLVWSASSKSPGSFVIQLYVTMSRCFSVSEEATKGSSHPFFVLTGCAQRDFQLICFSNLHVCWTIWSIVQQHSAGILCLSPFSVWTPAVMFVGWLWWMVVVDHCHCQSGAPCHIWQQSDMVIQSWGYEWLGVGSPGQTWLHQFFCFRCRSQQQSPCWWLTGHLSRSTILGLTKSPSYCLYVFKSNIFAYQE